MRSPSAKTLARLACCAPLLFLIVACAKIVDLEDSQSPEQTEAPKATPTSTSSSSSSSSTSSGGSSTSSSGNNPQSGSSSGAGGDASTGDSGGPPPPMCPADKRPNNDSCTQPSQCCSGKCSDENKCTDSCRANQFEFCAPLFGNHCCVRMFCSSTGQCLNCIKGGNDAAGGRASSCCSGKLEPGQNPARCANEDS